MLFTFQTLFTEAEICEVTDCSIHADLDIVIISNILFLWRMGLDMRINQYRIELDVDFETDFYKGHEEISLVNEGEPIILNSSGIDIREIRVNGKKTGFTSGEADDDIAIAGSHEGDVLLEIEFENSVSETLMGFYVAKAQDGSKMFTTQFESTGARMAFPCFDNPSLKAEFALTVKVDEGLDCISNMPPASITSEGKKRKFEFEKTPRMSTYLLYFGIGQFDEMTEKHHGVDITLAALKGNLDSTRFPIDVAGKCLDYYNTYFDIPYALPKMHLISVPQFGAGAMENWGAITFREIRILVNESTTESSRRAIAEVIAHEITHMWFGDLVTMKWWNDLWLNESFATFMSVKAVDKFYPEWDQFGSLLIGPLRTRGAFLGDSLSSSHPIDSDVKDPESVAQIFDEISYGKGASILRMIEAYVGEENFRKGISEHLKRHSYDNAAGEDLWKSLEDVSSLPVSHIMSEWIKKKGYPVVKVSRNGSQLILKQEQFLLSGERTDEKWPIPLTVVRENGTESMVFEDRETTVSSEGFVKLNDRETGFYRVLYDSETLRNILDHLNDLHQYDVFGLVDDLKAFLLSGLIDLDTFLSSLEVLQQRKERIVTEIVLNAYSNLYNIMPDNAVIREQAVRYLQTMKDYLGNKQERENGDFPIMRGDVYSLLALLDDSFALELSMKFDDIFSEDPNIRPAIAMACAQSKNSLDLLVGAMQQANSDEDRLAIVRAMGRLSGEKNPDMVFSLIDEGRIKKQDFMYYFSSLATNPKTREIAVDHLADFIDRMNAIFQKSGTTSRIIYNTAPLLALTMGEKVWGILREKKDSSTEIGISKAREMFDVYKKLVSKKSR